MAKRVSVEREIAGEREGERGWWAVGGSSVALDCDGGGGCWCFASCAWVKLLIKLSIEIIAAS